MAEAATVWMVHARTTLDGVRGTLSLSEGAVLFEPEGGRSAETVIPIRDIRRVRRTRGSPVMELRVGVAGGPSLIGFYFVKPPSLSPPTEGFRLFGRYLARRRAIAALRAGNAAMGGAVDRWVDSLEDARRRAEEGE